MTTTKCQRSGHIEMKIEHLEQNVAMIMNDEITALFEVIIKNYSEILQYRKLLEKENPKTYQKYRKFSNSNTAEFHIIS